MTEKPRQSTPPETAPPGPKVRRRRQEPPRPPSEQHRRRVQIIKAWFRLFPLEGARWVLDAAFPDKNRFQVHEARWIEQPPKGPSHLVPPPRKPDEGPPTVEGLFANLIRQSVEDEAKKSDNQVRVELVEFDRDEAMRQTLAEGGCEIELLLQAEYQGGKRKKWILGVLLPDELEDGAETSWEYLRSTSWHLLVGPRLAKTEGDLSEGEDEDNESEDEDNESEDEDNAAEDEDDESEDDEDDRVEYMDDKYPSFMSVPLYLWPGTGLEDPQENASVIKSDFPLPGLLGSLLSLQSEKQREAERKSRQKSNLERLAFHEKVDKERREAAARRRERTGHTGISEAELAALVPDIDVDNDFVSLMMLYEIVRLWDHSMEGLLESLPPQCLGLALFGHRPAGMSDLAAFERCAFELRRALLGRTDSEAKRAGAALAVLGTEFIDPAAAEGLLRKMKLL